MQPGGYGEKAFLTLRVSQEVLRRWNGDGESSGLSLGIEAWTRRVQASAYVCKISKDWDLKESLGFPFKHPAWLISNWNSIIRHNQKKKRNGSLVYIHLYVLSRLEWSWKLPISDIIVMTRYQCLLSFKTSVGQSLWYFGSSSSASLSSLLEYAHVHTDWVFLKLIIAVIGIEMYSQSRHRNTKFRLVKMKYKIYNSGNSTAQPYLIQLSDTSFTWQ